VKYNRKTFFDGFKRDLDPTLNRSQVDGINFLLESFEADGHWTDTRHVSYALATIYHETAGSMQPVEEGYYLGSDRKVKAFQKTLRYYPYFGRGYVQLTWRRNYEKAGKAINVDLENKPELALLPENAFQILTLGMFQGWFTGKKLADYINVDHTDYLNARKIINGTDRAGLIAGYARSFESLLKTSAASSDSKTPDQGDSEQSANSSDTPATQDTSPPTNDNPPTEVKVTTVEDQTKTEVTAIPGHSPDIPPTQVSQGKWFSRILAGFGGATGIGTAIWGWAGGHLDAIGIGLICFTVLVLALIFRTAILDAIRMQSAADPTKYNVK
jgi:hypothetical protein